MLVTSVNTSFFINFNSIMFITFVWSFSNDCFWKLKIDSYIFLFSIKPENNIAIEIFCEFQTRQRCNKISQLWISTETGVQLNNILWFLMNMGQSMFLIQKWDMGVVNVSDSGMRDGWYQCFWFRNERWV